MGNQVQDKVGSTRNSESIREFITIAVHDLREPLRSIRTSSDVLAAACHDLADERAARSLRFIQDGVGRMESLIHDLAEYGYEEVRAFDRVEVSLEGALLEAKNQLSGELVKNAAALTYDPLPVVKGDFHGLTALFRCLLENACKFRGEEAPRIHVEAAGVEAAGVEATGIEAAGVEAAGVEAAGVEAAGVEAAGVEAAAVEATGVEAAAVEAAAVEAAADGSAWVVSVRDNGLGFNPQYSDRIFRPFERLNGKRYSGSGLGLALAKSIVERHGGRIWAESKPGEGSLFSFSLPAAD